MPELGQSETSTLIEETAEMLWLEQGHAKPWVAVAEATKERFRKMAERELSEVFCDGR